MVAQKHTVEPAGKGQRLDRYLAQAFPDLSRSRLKALMEGGHLTVDGEPARAAKRLKGGERVVLEVPPPAPRDVKPEDLPLDILYEDASLLVVNKAAGMVVHPAAGNWQGTLANALVHHVRSLPGAPALRPGLVHRLDKDTSGCLVIAKTDAVLAALQRSFKAREVDKTYLAVVRGHPSDQGRLETPYGRHPVHRKKFTGRGHGTRIAVTEYTVVRRFARAALLEVRLHTGRTHQIRVHLSEAGFPLLGDVLYGGRRSEFSRQALHAWRLTLDHPETGRRMAFEAPVPVDLQALLERL